MTTQPRYHAVIRSEFVTDPARGLTLGVAALPASGLAGELLVMAHTDHPRQANDDAAGVAVVVEVARRLARDPLPAPHMGVRFLFAPETIGSVCYLSQHPEVVANLRAGIFVEMPGTYRDIALQHSYPGGDRIDQMAQKVLRWRYGPNIHERGFRQFAANDEGVVNGPGVGVPCISLQRWPYPEYHTSDDTPDIIDPVKLDQMAETVVDVIRLYCTDYVPVRRFTGPVFLSGYGLWGGELSLKEKEHVMLRLEGEQSIFDIARAITKDYWLVREFCEALRAKGLVGIKEG